MEKTVNLRGGYRKARLWFREIYSAAPVGCRYLQVFSQFLQAYWRNGYKILLKAFLRRSHSIKIIIRRLAVLNFRLGQCYLEEKSECL